MKEHFGDVKLLESKLKLNGRLIAESVEDRQFVLRLILVFVRI